MHFLIETNCRETPKFSDLDEFLDLDREVHGFLYFLVEISRQILTASRQISTASRQISTISTKISTEKKKSWSWHDGHSRRFSKVSLDAMDVLDLDWSRTLRPPGLHVILCLILPYSFKTYFKESTYCLTSKKLIFVRVISMTFKKLAKFCTEH